MPYSTMVGENFEFLISEMLKNAVNYQKSDSPPGRSQRIQTPHQKHFSPCTLKFLGEMTLWCNSEIRGTKTISYGLESIRYLGP